MRRPINSVNGFYKDPNLPYSAQDALNVLPMMAEKGGTRTLSKLVDAPGLKPFVRIGVNDGETFTAAGAGRGMRVVDNKLFVVAGRNLWQITAAGVSINHGVIPGVGRVSMAHNQRGQGNELAIDNGQSRYVFNTQTMTLQKVTDESFPGSIKAFFIDGYLGYIEPQGRYWGHSDLSDALNYIAFDAYEAEGQPDRIVTGNVNNREVQIVGQETTELYVNAPTGAGSAPFQRASNTIYPYGSSARDSCANIGGSTVLLDQNRVVRLLSFDDARISTSVIETALQDCTRQQIANAYSFTLEAEGFQIYYLTVPGKFTFGYDFKNREWHRRASTGLDWWAVTDVMMWNGDWIALDSRTGELFKVHWREYPFDGQQELVREWVTGVVSADQNPVFVHELELLFGSGGQAYEPVDFPEQPPGPTISGSLPDGSVAISWAGGTFTASGGTPPYRFTTRPGTSFPGNLGPLLSSGVVASEVPDTPGVGTVVPRVTDANGLFDEITETFVIAPPMMAIYGTNAVDSSNYRVGSGINWPGSWTLRLGIQGTYGLIGTEETFVLYQVSGHPLYSEDFGTTFPASTGAQQNGSGGARHGWYSRRDNVVALPQASGNGVNISQDKGRTYTATGTYAASAVACIEKEGGENRWIIIQNSDIRVGYSTDKFTTQSSFTAIPDASFAIDCPTWANSEFCLVGGSTPLPYAPKLWKTTDGITLTPETLPAGLTGQAIVVIGGGTIGEYEYIIIATDTGKRAYLDPAHGEWKMCSTDFIGRPWGIAYNEAVIAMIGGNQSSGDTDGYIDYTLDGENFTTSLTWPLNSGENGRAIAAMITP